MESPESKVITFDKQDLEAQAVKYIFLSLDFTYHGTSGRPNGFDYLSVKDTIRWNGLKPKDYIPLIRQMFHNYVNNLKK